MAKDLERWSGGDDAPSEMQELLKAARDDVPSAQQLSGLEGKLATLLDAPPAPPHAAPTEHAAPSSGMPTLAKLAVLVAVAGLVGTGAYLSSKNSNEPAPKTAPTPVTPAKPAAPKPAAPEPVTPSAGTNEVAEPAAADASEAAPPEGHPAPQHRAATAAKPSEASLLDRARRALKSDPRKALALTRQHKKLYPAGALAQEREVIAIEALSLLNQKGSAQQRANEFSEKYPESAHQKKVDTSLKE